MNFGLPIATAVLLLSACAATIEPPPSGATLTEVEAVFGRPQHRLALPDGDTLLEFDGSGAPQTHLVRMDPQGRMISVEQVLTESQFRKIIGDMPREQVLATIGHPSTIDPGGRMSGKIWIYHYRNTQCQSFQVVMGYDGRTIGPGTFGLLPACMHRR